MVTPTYFTWYMDGTEITQMVPMLQVPTQGDTVAFEGSDPIRTVVHTRWVIGHRSVHAEVVLR